MFIYVFDEESRDMMIKDGFDWVSANPKQHVYGFVMRDGIDLSEYLNGHKFVLSNTMTSELL